MTVDPQIPAATPGEAEPVLHPHPVFAVTEPQMSNGERAALEGVLSQLRPRLAIEIGTAEGATLRRIAAHASEVHSFDLFEPVLDVAEHGNVTLHTGDSHELLPRVLADFAGAGRNVDFVLVDGDHSADGVRRDLEDLLSSPALTATTILIHDTSNPTVRGGLDAVDFGAYPKVAAVELDWIAGYVFSEPHFAFELWGGLGCVVVDAARGPGERGPMQDRYVPTQPLLERGRRAAYEADPQSAALEARLAGAERAAREQLARGDAEHDMRVAAQRRVAELEGRRLRHELAAYAKGTARKAARRLRRRSD